jgi:hypothetical protein
MTNGRGRSGGLPVTSLPMIFKPLAGEPLGFNGTLRREVLNAEWFTSIRQAQIVIETWMKQYNHIRPHQALNMRPPVPETLLQSGT